MSIDICDLGYDILMRNPARESCRHPSCNQDTKVWSSHLPCSQGEFNSLPCIQEVPLPARKCSSYRKHAVTYTPQMKSYFIQPSAFPKLPNFQQLRNFQSSNKFPKHPSFTQQWIRPAMALRDLIDWTIENELYL